MNGLTKQATGGQLTRRALLRGVIVTGGSMILYGLPAHALTQKASVAKKKRTPCVGSVFCTSCGPNNPAKGYDNDPVYGIFSVWLMLTTEDWDNCLKDPNWRKQLAGEFKVNLAHVNALYDKAHDATRQTVGNYSYSNLDLFTHLKAIWQKYKVETLKMPAESTYPGGTLLRQIAYKFRPLPASTFLQERCGGGGVNTSPAMGHGPLASWLMLVTEDWKACLQQDSWRNGLADEFKIPRGALDDLYQRSEDTSLVSENQRYTNRHAFEAARVQFQQWLTTVPIGFYGGHPCSGGKTLLQIARGGK